MTGRFLTDAELETMRRELDQCKTRVERLESERRRFEENAENDTSRENDLESLRQRLIVHAFSVW